MSVYTASIDDARIGFRAGYVYCVFAPRFRAAYVGQTWSNQGALARLAQHLSNGGTFRKRICDNFGYDEVDIGPIVFVACELDRDHPEFHGRVRDQREAVEAAVQFGLLNRLARDAGTPCVVVSRVATNSYSRTDYVRDAAAWVLDAVHSRALSLLRSESWGRG